MSKGATVWLCQALTQNEASGQSFGEMTCIKQWRMLAAMYGTDMVSQMPRQERNGSKRVSLKDVLAWPR